MPNKSILKTLVVFYLQISLLQIEHANIQIKYALIYIFGTRDRLQQKIP